MEKNQYWNFQIKEKLLGQNRLLKLGFFLSTVTTITMAVSNINAVNKIQIEILPQRITRQMIIAEDKINHSGVVMFTRTAFDLFLNHTPRSAELKFDEFLQLVQTESFNAVKSELNEELDRIRRLNIVSAFHIESLETDPDTANVIVAKGLRTKTSFGHRLGEKVHQVETWGLKYNVTNYNFKIVEIVKHE